MTGAARLHFIDCARTYAVFLALLSHALIATGVYKTLGDDQLYIRQFTRTATPMFVFMFGFMIEFVYVDKVTRSGLQPVRRRLHVRAFQCYCAFLLTSFCSFLGGHRTLSEFLDSTVFLDNSRFGNILRVYAVVMLFAPLFIVLRVRYGRVALVLGLVTVMWSFALTATTKAMDFGAFNEPLNVVLGVGPGTGGPSVWHSLCFVFAGMFVASSLQRENQDERKSQNSRFYLHLAVMLALCSAAWFVLVDEKLIASWWSFVDATYRKQNMAGYFIIGTVTSVLSLLLFRLVIGTGKPPRIFAIALPIGLSSLISYTVGNVLLNLIGGWMRFYPIPSIVLFFVLVLIITANMKRLPYYETLNGWMNFRSPSKYPVN